MSGLPATPVRAVIETPRLVLRASHPLQAAEALAFHERNRAHLARWSPPLGADFHQLDTQRAMLEADLRAFADGTAYRYWLTMPASHGEALLGSVRFSQVARGPFQNAMLGYSLDAALEGRGLMSEALAAAIAEMFSPRVNLHRVQASYRIENQRSAATLARLGFRIEGQAKDYLFIDGAWRDHVVTALTNPAFTPPPGW